MNILVIGDTCKDIFIYGKCDRMCPEAPVPIFNPVNKNWNYGMAGNVYENIKALADDGVIRLFKNKTITKKSRFVDIDSNQMIMRLDENDVVDRIDWNNREFGIGNGWDAIVISDYNKGFLTINDIEYICDTAKMSNIPVFVDTKKKLIDRDKDYVKNVFCFKINENEYRKCEPFYNEYYGGHVVVTEGSRGCTHRNMKTTEYIHYDIEKKSEVHDLSGAGDTFLAGLVVEYIRTKDFSKAIKFANKCASWVVTQKGVVTINLDKINE